MDKPKAAASEAVEEVVETTKKVEKKIEKKLTYLWDEIDETVNIYTHLLGSFLFLLLSLSLYNVLYTRYPYATKEDVYAFSCFFLGAIACLGMSATYHTISNHSHAVAVWGNQLDYAGIVLLIWGSFVPVLYYTFQDRPDLQQKYRVMVSTYRSIFRDVWDGVGLM
jgi:adiponectin receptor